MRLFILGFIRFLLYIAVFVCARYYEPWGWASWALAFLLPAIGLVAVLEYEARI